MEMESIRDSYSLGVKPPPKSVTATAEWRRLVAHARHMKRTHLRDVMGDAARCEALSAEFEGSFLDYSRMQVSVRTMQLLFALARRQKLQEKIAAMCRGDKINNTENRAVLHTALRAAPGDGPIMVDGVNVVDQVHEVLAKVSKQQCITAVQHTRYELSSIMQLKHVGRRQYCVVLKQSDSRSIWCACMTAANSCTAASPAFLQLALEVLCTKLAACTATAMASRVGSNVCAQHDHQAYATVQQLVGCVVSLSCIAVTALHERLRAGKEHGVTGKLFRNIVAVGIGGSYLGPEFVHEAFKTEGQSEHQHHNEYYNLRFLSNVDPVDVRRTLYDLAPEETLIIVISKTFTTAETMLNARTARQWLWDAMGK
eukprot:3690-Heterococcus_DN1.PRE.1